MNNSGTQMTETALRAGTYTVCLDTEKASDDTYMNWDTFRLRRMSRGRYMVDRLTNRDGNGQEWNVFGDIAEGRLMVGRNWNAVTTACATLLARKFGLRFTGGTVALFPVARIWGGSGTRVMDAAGTQVGRKTAAPTLLGRNRNKNRNMERERVAALDFASQMRAKLAREARG